MWYIWGMKKAMIIVAIVLAASTVFFSSITKAVQVPVVGQPLPSPIKTLGIEDIAPTIDLDKLHLLVNNERSKAGIKPLERNSLLDMSAQAKCNDIAKRDYWAHDTPDGKKFWDFIHDQGIDYATAGENLAYKQRYSETVVRDWMNSEGHKKNILTVSYRSVGYAQCRYEAGSTHGINTITVQHLARINN